MSKRASLFRTNPFKGTELDEFVQCYHAENPHERTEIERFKGFAYDDLLERDNVNLDRVSALRGAGYRSKTITDALHMVQFLKRYGREF